LEKTFRPCKTCLGRSQPSGQQRHFFQTRTGKGGGGGTRKSFSLSPEMRVWITVNLKKTMAGEEALTPLFSLLPWILIFSFWMVHCHVAVQVGPQKRIINFSIRQSGSIWVTLAETALRREEDGKWTQEYFTAFQYAYIRISDRLHHFTYASSEKRLHSKRPVI